MELPGADRGMVFSDIARLCVGRAESRLLRIASMSALKPTGFAVSALM